MQEPIPRRCDEHATTHPAWFGKQLALCAICRALNAGKVTS